MSDELKFFCNDWSHLGLGFPMKRRVYFVSPAVMQQLEMLKLPEWERPALHPIVHEISGLPVRVDPSLPRFTRTGNIIQKDRFATYEKADMEWAEPLGLAAWETERVDMFAIDEPSYMSPPIMCTTA